MISSLALASDSPTVNLGLSLEIGDLLVKLYALFQLDPTFCFPTDSSLLIWQLKTPAGVRLLYLSSNDIALPRDCELRSALERYLFTRGLRLHIDLPPLLHTAEPSLAVVVAARGSLEIRAVHEDVTVALLMVTLELLKLPFDTPEGSHPLGIVTTHHPPSNNSSLGEKQ